MTADCKCGLNCVDSMNIFTFVSWPIDFCVPSDLLAYLSAYLHIFWAKVWLSCHSLLKALFCNARHWKCRIARIVLVRKGLHTPVPPSKPMPATFACGGTLRVSPKKIKQRICPLCPPQLWSAHRNKTQVLTDHIRSYTTKLAPATILGLLYQVISEGFGKLPLEYDRSPVDCGYPILDKTYIHWLGHDPAGWEKDNITEPCDLHFVLQGLQSMAILHVNKDIYLYIHVCVCKCIYIYIEICMCVNIFIYELDVGRVHQNNGSQQP